MATKVEVNSVDDLEPEDIVLMSFKGSEVKDLKQWIASRKRNRENARASKEKQRMADIANGIEVTAARRNHKFKPLPELRMVEVQRIFSVKVAHTFRFDSLTDDAVSENSDTKE